MKISVTERFKKEKDDDSREKYILKNKHLWYIIAHERGGIKYKNGCTNGWKTISKKNKI